jgi:SAM-dependent methyltransferase
VSTDAERPAGTEPAPYHEPMETTFWLSPAEDEAMQEDHGFIWRAMLDTIDVDLTGRRVLDAGCNRGGFLRLLADRCEIAEGFGYDPASGAVLDAQRLAGGRPLHYQASGSVPAGWDGLDVAFSHEVLYLLDDLAAHAAAIFHALAPGGVYYAVLGVHAGSSRMAQWHRASARELRLPRLYDIDQVIAVFQDAGFEAAASRLAMRFVPAVGHGHDGQLLDWLDYYYEQKLMLRFERPASAANPADGGPGS